MFSTLLFNQPREESLSGPVEHCTGTWFVNILAALSELIGLSLYLCFVSSYHLLKPYPGLATSGSTDQQSNSHSGSKAINSQMLWQSFACALGMV